MHRCTLLCNLQLQQDGLDLIFVPELHEGSARSDEDLDSFKSPHSDKIQIIRKSTYLTPGLGIHSGPS